MSGLFVVAYNTNTGFPNSWFCAFNEHGSQIMSREFAEKVADELANCSVQDKNPKCKILRFDNARVKTNPRSGYVRII